VSEPAAGLDAHARAELIALLPHLEAGVDTSLVAFVRDHYHALLAEAGALPGVDQTRAAVIRLLRLGLFGADAPAAFEAARDALRAYPAQLATEDVSLLVSRHPAWVGLCSVELEEGLVDEAIALARAGFGALPVPAPAGPGELLWAMAEEAEAVEWDARARDLLTAACDAEFDDPENAFRVRLLLAVRLVSEDETEAGLALLGEIAESSDADDETRVQAWWAIAQVRRDQGDELAARAALTEAHALALTGDDDAAADRILAAIDDVDPPEDEA
jgi:hypothetical protein